METVIKNKKMFDLFCKAIASNVLSENMLSEEKISRIIKMTILTNLSGFIESLADATTAIKLKRKVGLIEQLQKNEIDNKEYKAISKTLGKLNLYAPLLKNLNDNLTRKQRIEKERNYELIQKFLVKNGHKDILKSFNDTIKCSQKIE